MSALRANTRAFQIPGLRPGLLDAAPSGLNASYPERVIVLK
jgi:hypothetical protein